MSAPQGPLPEGYADVPHRRDRLKMRRRAIARNLTAAAQIPSLTADVQIDLTALLRARAEWNAGNQPEEKLSVLAFLARTAVSALAEFPDLNATFTDTEMIRWESVNLGVAVDSPGGLMVPVIRDAQHLGVQALGAAIRLAGQQCRDGSITAEGLIGGTFTLSNPGAVGPSIRAEALLNPPQVGLLGLPGMRRDPVAVIEESGAEVIAIRPVIRPSLTFDHRAIDGGYAIRYLVAIRDRAESWKLPDYT